MKTDDFNFDLPEHLIAHYPIKERTESRMLKMAGNGSISHLQFVDLLDAIKPQDILVFNNTRVIPARVFGKKKSGGKLEVLLERQLDQNRALVHLKASRAPKTGDEFLLGDEQCEVLVEGRQENLFIVSFPSNVEIDDFLKKNGHMPLPPYITRNDEVLDKERYQTVYASNSGAVAAPTAGLHFDEVFMNELKDRDIQSAFVTLHVGAGTFQPVKVESIFDHVMHSERYFLSARSCEKIARVRADGGRVIAVGTTTVRCLESAVQNGKLVAGEGETSIFITPGYSFQMVDCLLTNFHFPRSTLLMLVSAFAGVEQVREAYREAIEREYRFYSYGDCMFLERNQS